VNDEIFYSRVIAPSYRIFRDMMTTLFNSLVTGGSGNVYADTGHPNPEETLAKAELAILISNVIKKKKLTQKQTAMLIGVINRRFPQSSGGNCQGLPLIACFVFLWHWGWISLLK